MAPPDPGAKTIGRYQILEELGRGAMGIVYKGHDPVIGRTVALKTIAIREDSEMPDLRQRLYREACAAGTLTHPNIVTVYDVLEEKGVTAVAMEFVEGETLKDLITARAPMPIEMALDLFEQIAAALDYAGNRSVVHRDIKPANIMVTPDGRAKVADFGLARMGGSTMTATATILGTPSYMSPEQARGMVLDGRSDMFSAAAVFFEMVTRQKVFAGKDLGDTLERIVSKPAPLASQFNPALDQSVTAVIDRALSKDPAKRYATGAEFVAALRDATETDALPTIAVPDGGDHDAKTIVMLPRSALAAMSATEVLPAPTHAAPPAATAAVPTVATPKPATRTPTARARPAAPVVDPDLHRTPQPDDRPSSARGLVIAIVAAAVVLGGIGLAVVTTMRNQAAQQTALTAAPGTAAQPVEPPARAEPAAPAVTKPPAATAAPLKSTPPAKGQPRSTPQRSAVPDSPASESSRPVPAQVAATGTLHLAYDGAPYPLTLVADGRTIGRVSDGQTTITVDAGRMHLRAVNDQLFLDQDLGSVSVAAGERHTLTIPTTAAVFIGVRGDNYTGLRILLDGKALAGPYPAQLPRIAATTHKIEFRWSDGLLQGVDIADTIDLSNGKQFTIRAVPEGATVAIQKLR